MPQAKDVQADDRLRGGVALRACDDGQICVYPYVFREVCSNGAIMAHSTDAVEFVDQTWQSPAEAKFALHAAIRTCCADHVFAAAVEEIRPSLSDHEDPLLALIPLISHLSTLAESPNGVAEIIELFMGQADMSRFGMMNAVTAVARDLEDPDLRWKLEVVGGAIPSARASDLNIDTDWSESCARERSFEPVEYA